MGEDCSQFASVNSWWQFIYLCNWTEWFGTKIRTTVACASQFLGWIVTPSKVLWKVHKAEHSSRKQASSAGFAMAVRILGKMLITTKPRDRDRRIWDSLTLQVCCLEGQRDLWRGWRGAAYAPGSPSLRSVFRISSFYLGCPSELHRCHPQCSLHVIHALLPLAHLCVWGAWAEMVCQHQDPGELRINDSQYGEIPWKSFGFSYSYLFYMLYIVHSILYVLCLFPSLFTNYPIFV